MSRLRVYIESGEGVTLHLDVSVMAVIRRL